MRDRMSATAKVGARGIALLMMCPLVLGACSDGCSQAYTPPREKVANPAPTQGEGRSSAEVSAKASSGSPGDTLDNIRIDDAMLKLGEQAFYEETFGNEVFLTDVLGMLSGPLTASKISEAIIALRGEPTSNLRVELAEDALIGGRKFHKGEPIDTGIDVARASLMPLGMKLRATSS